MSRKHYYLLFGLTFLTAVHANPQTLNSASGNHADAVGVWYSEQNGWLLEVTSNNIQRYQYSEGYCYKSNTNGPTFMGSIEYRYFTRIDAHTARFDYLRGDGFATFTLFERLPARCRETKKFSNPVIFELVVSMFEEFYPRLNNQSPTWPELVSKHRTNLAQQANDEQLYNALTALIGGLSDSHTKLFAKINGTEQRFQAGLGKTLERIRHQGTEQTWLRELVAQLLNDVLDQGGVQTANERVVWGTLDKDIGYIQVFTMGGFTQSETPGSQAWADAEIAYFDQLMTQVVEQLTDTDALIIDLSNNRGGYDVIARQIASYFTTERVSAYQVKNELTDQPWRTYTIDPAPNSRYAKPVYVLTSDVTVSGGEIATLSLKQLSNVTHVGTRTRGSFSTPLAKPLPNGWYLELSNELYVDMQGFTHEGHGIEPDIELEVYTASNPVESHRTALLELVRIITQQSR